MSLSKDEVKELKAKARVIRKEIINIAFTAGGGHVGGSLSQTDILVCLYYKYMNIDPKKPDWDQRDRFILSKGHGGLGWAAVLGDKGYFDKTLLKNFNKTGSPFGMHLDMLKVPGCDASTGSLGHGIAIAMGLAKAAKLKGEDWRTYCMVGDGELCEGSNWEAASIASHHKLDNLTGFVDRNRLMIDGFTEEISPVEPLEDRFQSFGWNTLRINGHDLEEISNAIEKARSIKGKPTMIICDTIKGKGVKLFENQPKWHYGGLDSDIRDQSIKSIDSNDNN
ncbi:MAG: transketolase [Thermodesulfobacteriota bacterium]|nr:transketolase [Thermodesulfobacteriota bacterium]